VYVGIVKWGSFQSVSVRLKVQVEKGQQLDPKRRKGISVSVRFIKVRESKVFSKIREILSYRQGAKSPLEQVVQVLLSSGSKQDKIDIPLILSFEFQD